MMFKINMCPKSSGHNQKGPRAVCLLLTKLLLLNQVHNRAMNNLLFPSLLPKSLAVGSAKLHGGL